MSPHAGEPAAELANLTIQPLTPDGLDDLAILFDQPGDPKWCWCSSFIVPGSVKARPRDENRAVLTVRTITGPSPGLVASTGGRPVGWVSLGPRDSFARLAMRAYGGATGEPAGGDVWSIVCFVVDPRERGRGLARRLLTAAIDHARAGGAAIVEGYPIDPGPERIPNPIAYAGTLRMFLDAGFRIVGERPVGAVRWPRPIVRREV
jgi:GNAT superfamily N-acetyltransferase